jgi:CBS domain containing-hemolysin-like protein
LAAEPGHFLSTTQIGIVVMGIVSGAFAAESVAKQPAGLFTAFSVQQSHAETLALVMDRNRVDKLQMSPIQLGTSPGKKNRRYVRWRTDGVS